MDKVLLQTWKLQKCTEFSKSPKEMQWHEKLDIDSNTFENFNHFCDITYKSPKIFRYFKPKSVVIFIV